MFTHIVKSPSQRIGLLSTSSAFHYSPVQPDQLTVHPKLLAITSNMDARSVSVPALVIVTKYTTVYPTGQAQVSSTSAIITSASQTLTTAVSSTFQLNSIAPASTLSASTVSSSASRLMTTPLISSIPPFSSITRAPTGAPVGSKHPWNDTSVGVIAAAFILLALLLLAMIGNMIYLRCKGKCPNCLVMSSQLEKWQTGELKRITPHMVRQREAINKTAASSNASSDIDIEMGSFGGPAVARAATLDTLETNKEPSFWKKTKGKFLRKGKAPATDLESVPETGELQFVMSFDDTDNDAGPSRRVSSERPQTPLDYEPNTNHLYQPRVSTYTYASTYSQPDGFQRDDPHGSRVFADYAPTDLGQRRGPLRKDTDGPSRYMAFGAREKEHRVQMAEDALQSDEYKRAESILKRGSAPEHQLRRALSIVNLADQTLNMARDPSMYLKSPAPSEHERAQRQDEPAQVEQYEMIEWRKKGYKAPEVADI